MLNVNRNTINEDIRHVRSEMYEESKTTFSKDWLDKQFTRLELQQARLREELDKDISLKDRPQIEKFITNIDLSISSLIVKIESSRRFVNLWIK